METVQNQSVLNKDKSSIIVDGKNNNQMPVNKQLIEKDKSEAILVKSVVPKRRWVYV